MGTQNNEAVTDIIIAFLREIGLAVRPAEISENTILPGIKVEDGVLLFDARKLKFPGDLLHEAGHLAVKPASARRRAAPDLGPDPAEEMTAIAWSYAAALHLQISPEMVFHAEGYRGGSAALLENFGQGRYLAVPMLQWLGMTLDEPRARASGLAPYPSMMHWLRPS